MDIARARIRVVPRERRDVRRLLMQLAGNPTDLAAMEELAEAAIAYSAGELGIREAIPTGGDITGEIVRRGRAAGVATPVNIELWEAVMGLEEGR